jgi:hypothetical protein
LILTACDRYARAVALPMFTEPAYARLTADSTASLHPNSRELIAKPSRPVSLSQRFRIVDGRIAPYTPYDA